MQERRGGPAAGFLLAILVCGPLLFFGWWTVCLAYIVVALIMYHVPRLFGARLTHIILVGVVFLIAMGGMIGYAERSGFSDPGSSGSQEAFQGIITGMAVVSFPAGVIFGIVCVFDVLPQIWRGRSDEAVEPEEPDVESEDLESDQPQGGRTCSGCGAMIFGTEERCWRCGKRA
jgi:hypothetical protein